MLEKLSNTLKKTTDKIANAVFLDKKVVDSIVKDLQRSLIEADVNVSLVLEITKKIKKAALDERIKGIEKKEHLIKLLHEELVEILGTSRTPELKKGSKILLVGLYGSGKTTTTGKLGLYYQKRGKKVATISLDVHRPAAAEQLAQYCKKINVPCFISPKEKDPKNIWKEHKDKLEKHDLVIVDTAGRDSLDKELVKEISTLNKLIKPEETFLVLPADIGQTAQKQAQTFKENLDITGVIITRMDSTAKAGGALTACSEAKAPVIFIGTGENATDLETFNPEAFLSRLLGMGDLQTLMEKIQNVVDEKQIEKTKKNLEEGKLTLRDVQAQLESMESLGSMDKMLSLVPGLGKAKIKKADLEGQQEKLKRWKHAINSMTEEEIENPLIMEKETSRMQRISKGSGTTTSEIRMLIKQYKMLQELMKSQSQLASGNLDQKTMMKLAKKFGKKMKF